MSQLQEPRKIAARLVRQGHDEEAFDAEFWAAMTGEQRVELLWEMVLEARAIRGEVGDEPRLQRTVVSLRRI